MRFATRLKQTTVSIPSFFWALGLVLTALSTLFAMPAYAHHPFGGGLPANALEGFLSGLGHPVIGIDHLLFVVAAGLIGSLMQRGTVISVVFVLSSLVGTVLHLLSMDLPIPEIVISGSVVLFGTVLALGGRSDFKFVTAVSAISGIFHGYAYGEVIVGAEMAPLFSYLIGFASIQLAISLSAWKFGKLLLKKQAVEGLLKLRFIGFAIFGAGTAFLSGLVLG